jgi:hypothetical protein
MAASSSVTRARTIQLDDARVAHALGEILIGRTDNHTFDTCISSRRRRRGRQSVVRLEFHHGPDDNAGRREDSFEQFELGQEVWRDPFAGLVA